ncbi:MAG: hypothetical protein MK100_09875, partial [Phycisphaerales bacterium]|nr:hypothetical protein [Phycisphaerales bacterium]
MHEAGSGNIDALSSIANISKKTKVAEILEFFPLLVYKKLLDPKPEVFNAMFKFVEKFDEQTRNIATARESQQMGGGDMSEGMSGGMSAAHNDPKRPKASTGDVTGTGVISGLPEFEWLTREVEKCVIEYLDKSQINTRHLALFHQKSWPVVTRKDSTINWHSHPNASLSVVYYLNDLKKDEGGNLLFQNP